MSENKIEEKIGAIASLANLLYASYAARDFFAKVIPGFVTIILILYVVGKSPALSDIRDIPFAAWILVLGVFYAAGFMIQRVGETFPAEKYFTIIKLYCEKEDEYEKKVEEFFRKAPSMYHRAQRERFVVIKELYGNLAVSLIIVGIFLGIRMKTIGGLFSDEWNNWAVVLLLIVSIVGLLCGNRKLCKSEHHWIKDTIDNANK